MACVGITRPPPRKSSAARPTWASPPPILPSADVWAHPSLKPPAIATLSAIMGSPGTQGEPIIADKVAIAGGFKDGCAQTSADGRIGGGEAQVGRAAELFLGGGRVIPTQAIIDRQF